jgi:hypothetical protein
MPMSSDRPDEVSVLYRELTSAREALEKIHQAAKMREGPHAIERVKYIAEKELRRQSNE